ncbi:MAG: hypothetical protein QF406_14535, partial [Verrucomicrobiota bacterium]|nr:hypothetical protein [Verrucomicrobiota bacterium]
MNSIYNPFQLFAGAIVCFASLFTTCLQAEAATKTSLPVQVPVSTYDVVVIGGTPLPPPSRTGAVPAERPAIRPPSALNGWADWKRGEKIFENVVIPPAPPLSPEEQLATFKMAPGYRVELVAAEPMIADPVFFEFDADGRIWVLEYRGYMRDLAGTGEADPICRLMVLEDTNADGRSDKSTVYIDELVMPRSFAFVEGGVLLAEPPHLWFCQDHDGDLVCDRKR